MLSLLPINALADDVQEYNLWVGGVRVTSTNTSGQGWSYSGDNTSGTLTLTNANITGTYIFSNSLGANIYTKDIILTIELVGSNTVGTGDTEYVSGVYQDGHFFNNNGPTLTITGPGSLTSYGDWRGTGIISGGDLLIENCTVAAYGQDGIYDMNTISIAGSTVTAVGMYRGSSAQENILLVGRGICAALNLTISNSVVTAEVNSTDPDNAAISSKDIIIGDGNVIALPVNGHEDEFEDYDGTWSNTIYDNNGKIAQKVIISPLFSLTAKSVPSEGGTISGAGDYYSGQEATVGAVPNQGWRFANWTKDGTEVSTDPEYTFQVSANQDLVANFIKTNEVNVSASPSEGGTVSGGGIYDSGSTATVKAIPNEGYVFEGWYVPDASAPISTDPDYTFKVASDTLLTAIFSKTISRTVTFKVVNGSWNSKKSDPITVILSGKEGDKLTLSADQIPAVGNEPAENYKAGSWDKIPDTTTEIKDNPTYTYTYAEQEVEEPKKQYVISFDTNGRGNGNVQPITVAEGEKVKLPSYPGTAIGYAFTGWGTDSAGNGTVLPAQEEIEVTKDMTLYAQWKANQYTVRFDANTGTGTMDSITVNYDQKVKLTANAFTRSGYYFIGWNITADGSEALFPDQGEILNLTDTDGALVNLFAQWKNIYNVIEGANAKVAKGGQSGLGFKTDGDYAKFTGIRVDGNNVPERQYTSSSGSTIVELKPEYINELSVGPHTISFLYTDGSCETVFEVLAKAGERDNTIVVTDDPVNLPLWISILLISAIGMAAILLARKRLMR